MSTLEEIAAIEKRVEDLELTMSFVLRRAKVPGSTWARWKNGKQGPTKTKWDAVISTVSDLERRLKD